MSFISPDLIDQFNPEHYLVVLARKIPWNLLEEELTVFYHQKTGRPAKPIRLMTGLMVLKQMENLSDERIVEAWVGNPYTRYFCGETRFQWMLPCDPSDLTYFRKRIGEEGVRKIIEKCRDIAASKEIELHRSYTRTVKKSPRAQRFASHPNIREKAKKAQRQLRTIAGRLAQELYRKLPPWGIAFYKERLELFEQVLRQERDSKHKIYSLHETDVYRVSKGKEHKKYEFGSKIGS